MIHVLRLTTILPAVTLAEAIEARHIHRVAGLTGDRTALVTTRPFRAPHQTISDAGLISGGHVPMPGEVSLAHHGVRFLDERPKCRRQVLEVMRQPREEGVLYIQSRGRPGSQSSCDLSRTGGDFEGWGHSRMTRHHSYHGDALSQCTWLQPAPLTTMPPGNGPA
jgi:hypothetical protein